MPTVTMQTREREVEKTITVTETEETVSLEMTVEEAEVVRALTGCISGSSEFRTLADNVFFALDAAGIKRIDVTFEGSKPLYIKGHGAIISRPKRQY